MVHQGTIRITTDKQSTTTPTTEAKIPLDGIGP
jgi:hypothetical protein